MGRTARGGEMDVRRATLRTLAKRIVRDTGYPPTVRELTEKSGLPLRVVQKLRLYLDGLGLVRRAKPGGKSLRLDQSKAPNLDRMNPDARDAWLVARRNEVRDSWPPEIERVRRGEPIGGAHVEMFDRGFSATWKGTVTA